MPTISQLPPADSVSPADEVPISQAGVLRAASVGALLASVQPVITVDSATLLGRTSMGSGGPEQVDVGLGMSLSSGTLVADGLDHAGFALASNLSIASDLVISNQGIPMLMPASLLRGLFSAGQNVAINSNGTISATAANVGTIESGSSIGALRIVTELSSQDLVAIGQSGSDCAITYSNFLDAVTIDQAQPAGAAGDSDTTWVAQGSNVMASQTFAAIWVWIVKKMPTYRAPVVEITVNTNLDTTVHNGRLLICSQPVTLTPLLSNMGSGFQCTVINASTGDLTLASDFVSSSGSLVLAPWETATLSCATYSAGTIAFAAMPTTSAAAIAVPGQVGSVSSSGITSSTITVAWQAPSSGGAVSSYILQYRLTGTTTWSSGTPVVSVTAYQLTGLQAATSYDFEVIAVNAAGMGPASSTIAAVTLAAPQSVSTVTWNVLPNGPYTHASGAIGVNAHISPGSSPVQFGFSLSVSVPPSSWTTANLVNTDLWGAYVPTPAAAGDWYVWGEGLDGSAPTVSPAPFVVE